MGTPEIIFGLLVLAVGVFATAAYGMIPVDDKTARGCFYATAFFLIAVGIELGIVTSWPLGIKMLAAGSVAFVAIAGLTYVLNSRPFITGDSQTTQHDIEVLPPERGYLLLWDPPNKMYIQSVPWPGDKLPPEGAGVPSPQFRIKNLGTAVPRNLRLHWKLLLGEKDFLAAIEKPELFRMYNARFDAKESRFYIGGGETKTNEWNALLTWEFTSTMLFLAPEINNTTYVHSPIPYSTYQLIDIYSCAMISDDRRSRALITVPLTLTISWDEPSGGKPISFSVRAIIQGMDPGTQIKDTNDVPGPIPKITGTIGFEVEPLSP